MIDSHAHLNDPAFEDDLADVISRAEAQGVDAIINVGYDLMSSNVAVELAERFPGLWAVVGLHPHDAKLWTEELCDAIKELTQHPKVLAIGEVGLDYHYDYSPRDVQRHVFREQLALSLELDLPVVIHSREATKDTLDIVGEYPSVPRLLHCYSGSLETARLYEKMGHFFSFGGPITFKNANKLRDVVAGLPLERILLELAKIHGCTLEDVVRQTVENTREFFRLVDKEDL